jgi:hypothetical protein
LQFNQQTTTKKAALSAPAIQTSACCARNLSLNSFPKPQKPKTQTALALHSRNMPTSAKVPHPVWQVKTETGAGIAAGGGGNPIPQQNFGFSMF